MYRKASVFVRNFLDTGINQGGGFIYYVSPQKITGKFCRR